MRIHKRQGSPYWQYSFTVRGNRHRGSAGTTSKSEAQAIAAAKLAELEAAPQRPESWKLTHVLGTYYTDHAQHLRSHAFVWQKITLFDAMMDTNQPLSSLTTRQLMDFRAKRRGLGIDRPTINRDMAVLKAAINHAVNAHGLAAPAVDWKRLRYPENEHRVRFLSHEEFDGLIAAADAGMQLAITAAVTTGLRKTAMLGIEWHQIDLRGRTITIPKGKGRKPQVVGIASPLLKLLKEHRAASTAKAGDTKVVQLRGPVFDLTNFRKRWEKTRTDAGLVDFHWHDLRHTFATWARQGGADLLELQKAMAHSSVAVTARYMHIGADETVTAFDRAAAAMGKAAIETDNKDASA
ncbi:MAG: tyrosine-type recombinase/integrase [Blastomonas sp.]